MQKTCINDWCKKQFEVNDDDRVMLQKFDIDREPDQCPNCRHDHRRMFSPILRFHRRKSDRSGEPILSIFHPRHTFPVYAVKEWWSDDWDALSYGRAFDFHQPFFGQFAAFYQCVPKMANNNENAENCEYSYSCGNAKNVYYSRTVHRSEDVYYSQYVTGYNRSLCDCLVCQRSSFLYECVLCFNCSSSTYLMRSTNCGDCHFSTDLVGCTDCLFCNNLRNKALHVDNQPVSREEYLRIKAQVFTGQYSVLQQNLDHFAAVYLRTIWKNLNNMNSEKCVGDNLTNCMNCYQCFNCVNTQDARYCCRLTPSEKCVSSMDISSGGIGELLYNCVGLGGGNYFMRMCLNCRLCSHLTYCADCYSTKDCFGCVGLRNKRYCILNTQYSKGEYETLVPRIIEHMRKTTLRPPQADSAGQEWGEFFPIALSPFVYNEGNNLEEHPLKKDEVLRRGWQWQEETEETPVGTSMNDWPMDISNVSDTITAQVFTCSVSKKQYKIVPKELAFYRSLKLPIPHEHPDVRMARRRMILTPYVLCTRPCMKCKKEVETTYQPSRPEIVYCEECYLAEVY